MRVTSKGRVTIPQEIRNRLGLLPNTEVEFELAGDHATIRKARHASGESNRRKLALESADRFVWQPGDVQVTPPPKKPKKLRGSADARMSTDEILALTRGEGRRTKHK